MVDITHMERILVEMDGEEREVWNHVNIKQRHYVNAAGGHETFEPVIKAGNSSDRTPDIVTERVAKYLWDEFGIEPEDQGIEVVNIEENDDVTVI